jgi:hypothetical protein
VAWSTGLSFDIRGGEGIHHSDVNKDEVVTQLKTDVRARTAVEARFVGIRVETVSPEKRRKRALNTRMTRGPGVASNLVAVKSVNNKVSAGALLATDTHRVSVLRRGNEVT